MRMVIAAVRVWERVSADYQAASRLHTKGFPPTTPVSDVLAWANEIKMFGSPMGYGDLVITEAEALEGE